MTRPGRNLLLVDDDPGITALLLPVLDAEGFQVTAVADGVAMKAAFARMSCDLIVLDIMLPGEDGMSLCRWIRQHSAAPVIMLTAAGSEADRIRGLDSGADDYLTKPFSSGELLARIRAVLRRGRLLEEENSAEQPRTKGYHFNGWYLDSVRRRLTAPDGVLTELTSGEFDILAVFLSHPQDVLNRDRLLELARGRLSGPFDRTIDVQVGRLRRKLETDPRKPELIRTVRNEGYILSALVREE